VERTLLTLSVPNIITVWAIAFVGLLALALVVQLAGKATRAAPAAASTAGGY
jgi:hypothetical protein